MPNSLSTTGLTTATQQELLTAYTTALSTIYGAGINLQSDTPDGQLINLFIQSVLDVEDLLTQIYNSFDPDNAIGNVLDQRVAINGIQRLGGTYTITNVTVTTNASVNLYGLDQNVNPVYTVADSAGNQWELISTVLGLSVGANVLAFQAANPGAIQTTPNTITVPVTIILGVVSINNPTTYTTLGINEESDAALRLRRQVSVSLSSQGYLQGLLAALENINGVTSAFVYENVGSTTDANGVPGHSIWAIIGGTASFPLALPWSATTTYSYGQIASSANINYISWQNNNLNNAVTNSEFWGVYNPVAQAIYAKRNAGCGMKGATSYTVTQIDGTPFVIFYDVVIAEDLFISFTANSLDGIHAPNIAGIVSQLPSIYTPGVNAEVNINQMSTLVQSIDSNTLVTNSGFATAITGPFTTTLTPAYKNYQFVVLSQNIYILPMIMNAPGATPTIVSGLVTQMNISVAHGGNTIQFTGLGGYGTLSYSLVSGNGSINSSSGLYTSGIAGTDTVQVTDSLSNSAIAVILVT
jgi:hypothetical protein